MDTIKATRALGALSQESMLEAFRLLVRNETQGMPAGGIARALDIPHNTMSSHLSILANAGLVNLRRDGRSIIYSIDFDGTRAAAVLPDGKLLPEAAGSLHARARQRIAGMLRATKQERRKK